jgi:hypothetical protein
MKHQTWIVSCLAAACALAPTHLPCRGQQGPAPAATDASAAPETREVTLAGGRIRLQVPGDWQLQQPRVRIIEREFSVPADGGNQPPGRLTMMAAQGTVEQNIDRWKSQFTQPDGAKTEDRARTETLRVAGQRVHFVDISGTYLDRRGPFAPAVPRPDYRMLGAVLPTAAGQYFFKLYGPQAVIAESVEPFRAMLQSVRVGD